MVLARVNVSVMHGEENSTVVEGEISDDGRRFKVRFLTCYITFSSVAV